MKVSFILRAQNTFFQWKRSPFMTPTKFFSYLKKNNIYTTSCPLYRKRIYTGVLCLGSSYILWSDWNVPISHNEQYILKNPKSSNNSFNQSPSTVLIFANASIYVLWKLLAPSVKGHAFFFRHFVASVENFKARRWHSFLLSSMTHLTIGHLIVNSVALYVFLGRECLQKYLSPIETYSCFFGSGILASFFQTIISSRNVVGASAGVMTFLTLESFLNPFQRFVLLFPVPGMSLNVFQIFQFVLAVNILGVLMKSSANIAWFGHLIGMAVGCMYAMERRFSGDVRFSNSCPSLRDSLQLWKISCYDFLLQLQMYWVQFRMQNCRNNPVSWAELWEKRQQIKDQRQLLEKRLSKHN